MAGRASSVPTPVVMALCAGLVALLSPASAWAAPDAVRTSVGSAVATAELAGPPPSSVLIEAFDLDEVPGSEGGALGVSLAFGAFECVHDATLAASVQVAEDLSRATASGITAGTCTDRGQIAVPFTTAVALTWEGKGPVTRRTDVTHGDGQVCRTTRRERQAVFTGAVTWTSPDLESSAADTPSGDGRLTLERTVCRPV